MSTNRSKLRDKLLVLREVKIGATTILRGAGIGALGAGSGTPTVGVVASGGRTTTGAAGIDLGGGYTEGKLVIDIKGFNNAAASSGGDTHEAIGTIAAGIRKGFSIQLHGCKTSTFATREVILASYSEGFWGGATKATGWAVVGTQACLCSTSKSASALGGIGGLGMHVVLPFNNERNGRVYRYVRGFHAMYGTWVTGVDYSAYLSI